MGFWGLWYYEDLEEKDESANQWINDEAVYRTAPATPGLLNTGCDVMSVSHTPIQALLKYCNVIIQFYCYFVINRPGVAGAVL